MCSFQFLNTIIYTFCFGKLLDTKAFTLIITFLFLVAHRQCPYIIEGIIALAELGASAKDIVSLFPQVCAYQKSKFDVMLVFGLLHSFLFA